MDQLTNGQLDALRNLADKYTGNITAFVNIADARHLTDLGLASRSRQGWDITQAGRAHLSLVDRLINDHGASVTELHPVQEDDQPK